MNIIELIILGIGLGMDACSVAICKGLSMNKYSFYSGVIVSIWFATFQLLMPIIGFYFGSILGSNIKVYSHFLAFIILILLGINMIKESNSSEVLNDSIKPTDMLLPSIATSIDALSVGVTFSLLDINILMSSLIIFIVTFIVSFMGVKIGYLFGSRFKDKAQILGGIILILIGFKMII